MYAPFAAFSVVTGSGKMMEVHTEIETECCTSSADRCRRTLLRASQTGMCLHATPFASKLDLSNYCAAPVLLT